MPDQPQSQPREEKGDNEKLQMATQMGRKTNRQNLNQAKRWIALSERDPHILEQLMAGLMDACTTLQNRIALLEKALEASR